MASGLESIAQKSVGVAEGQDWIKITPDVRSTVSLSSAGRLNVTQNELLLLTVPVTCVISGHRSGVKIYMEERKIR